MGARSPLDHGNRRPPEKSEGGWGVPDSLNRRPSSRERPARDLLAHDPLRARPPRLLARNSAPIRSSRAGIRERGAPGAWLARELRAGRRFGRVGRGGWVALLRSRRLLSAAGGSKAHRL